MEIVEGRLPGVRIIRMRPIGDARGFFMRTFDERLFHAAGITGPWVQENHSRNLTRHTVRGLHFQRPPHGETKLVRCVRGAIFDVFVDLRAGSPTFGHWESIVLSEDEPTMVLVPKGFAHGYATLTDRTDVLYKVDHPYHPESEGGLFWNDPAVGITWPRMEAPVISPKDAAQPDLAAFRKQWGDLGAH